MKTYRLNPSYTFENYLVGDYNTAAKEAVYSAINGSRRHNPIYLYGAVGLGKTHLLQAFVYEAAKNKPPLKICYTTSEEFVHDMVKSILSRKYNDFIGRCMNFDALVIDDIHLLKYKRNTLKELLSIFALFYEARKQIIVSSDRPPKELFDMKYKISRIFQTGSVFELKSPLRKNIDSRDGVSFRELEGALNRAKFLASVSAY